MSKRERTIRIPILWILLPFAFGIFISYKSSYPDLVTIAVVGLVASAIYLKFYSKLPWLSLLLIAAIAYCSGYLRHQSASNKSPLIDTPPREAALTIRLESVFENGNEQQLSAVGVVNQVPVYFDKLKNERIYLSLEKSENLRLIEGSTIQTSGVIRKIDPPIPDESNGFDNYLRIRGVHFKFQQGQVLTLDEPAPLLNRFAASSRDALAKILDRSVAPDSSFSGAYKALMLGQKENLSPEQKNLFLGNGAMHLFAISGLHIGVIAACIHHLITLLHVKTNLRPFIVLMFVLCFVIVTGGAASSWRALLMTLCFYLCNIGKRQASPLSSLALSCLVYLILLPNELFQAGFQLSYLTVTSILLIGLPLARSFNQLVSPFKDIPKSLQTKVQQMVSVSIRWILNGLAVSTAAYLTAAPLGAYYFQILPTYGIPINLVALPIASLAIISGFISIIASPIGILPLSYVFNNAALVLIASIQWIMEQISGLPISVIETTSVNATLLFFSLSGVLLLGASSFSKIKQRKLWQISPIVVSIVTLAIMVKSN